MSQSSLLDFVFPSRCAVCEALGPKLCEGCWPVLRPYPHKFERGPVSGLAATYLSAEVSKLLVAFKDRGQSALKRELNELVEPLISEVAPIQEDVYLVPAPSRAENFSRRGFIPSALIARVISRSVPTARVMNCLNPGLNLRDQVGLTSVERNANLAGSMRLNQRVAHMRCFVVDDICTTGATVIEAWRALSVAGATVLGALVISEGKRIQPSDLADF
jgi:predicted amidophosphoribosyltransferase